MDENSKAEKFVALAETRVNKAIKAIELISNLSNKNNYQYTEEQVEQIYAALEHALAESKSKFRHDKPKNTFTFQ